MLEKQWRKVADIREICESWQFLNEWAKVENLNFHESISCNEVVKR